MTDDPQEAERRERHTRRLRPWHWALIAFGGVLIFMALLSVLIVIQEAARP